MKIKAIVLSWLLVALLFSAGCRQPDKNRPTGLTYILGQAKNIGNYWSGDCGLTPSPASSQEIKQGPKFSSQPGKKVYLTFDDGPDGINTPVILDILDNYGVKATFFVVGTRIEQNPGLLKEIVRRGHAVGNHTYNHKYKDIYSGTNGFLESIRNNELLIFRILGLRPHLVRDPGGKVRNSETVKQVLAFHGYRLVDWNVDSYDSRRPFPDGAVIIESVRRQAGQQHLWPNMVILMHDGDGHLNTVRALPTIIEMLLDQGFQFEVLK